MRKTIKILRSFFICVLVCICGFVGTACDKRLEEDASSPLNSVKNAESIERIEGVTSEPTVNYAINSAAAQSHIRYTIEDDLQEALPDYYVDYVESIYLSQEYVEELYYNSLKNNYFGYDYDEVAAYMQGKNWTFTVNADGQTVVSEVQESSDALVKLVKKVAIGTGVIVVCAVVSGISGGLGAAPVACFFAGAANGAFWGAVSGATVAGIVGGVISGVQTQSWEGAFDGALNAASDGYMWGAIAGGLTGGWSSTACFDGDTLVKTSEGYKEISTVEIGDRVYSYNEFTDAYNYMEVSNVIKSSTDTLVRVSVAEETIVTTKTHPFYTPQGWIEAKDLAVGTEILTNDGFVSVAFVETEKLQSETWVWNLTVPYTHTYTVTEEDVVVHNACGDSAKLRKNLTAAGDAVPDYPNAAHHIIPSSDARFTSAKQARQIYQNFMGDDINQACNGVFLPTKKGVSVATYHRTMHTEVYYDKVLEQISTVSSRQEMIESLSIIKSSLLNGTFI